MFHDHHDECAECLDIITGADIHDKRLGKLASCFPFIHQLDVTFPSNKSLEDALEALPKPHYFRQKLSLQKIVEGVKDVGHSHGDQRMSALVCSETGTSSLLWDDDVWCIDPRDPSILTLSVSKSTYETLGLIGKRVTMGKGKKKQGDGRHVISIPLHAHADTTKHIESQKIRARRDIAINRWETQRTQMQGLQPGTPTWNVVYSSGTSKAAQILSDKLHESSGEALKPVVMNVDSRQETLKDIKIPVVQLTPRPIRTKKRRIQSRNEKEEYEDRLEIWEHDMEELFKWIGMASLGSQRLKADNVQDSSYEAPSPSVVGSVTHLKWTGFLECSFVQSVIDTLVQNLSASCGAGENPSSFASITGHTCSWSPISYLPPNLQDVSQDLNNLRLPMRDPTLDTEDTWQLVLTGEPITQSIDSTSSDSPKCRWALARGGRRHDSWQ
ncbi:hypothetical protein D9758_008056 [Tetrapyrgos nigripes]|uniref:Uncharacterized protein n=1 Tax=Tetrapyrgos nigripes TaxID=182062 RepID=A0A8H5FW62_9AGAR|nr:hypothetical protein D9758_008056 [Tetrapyrgos nigripes]